jgi:hypothetical protein
VRHDRFYCFFNHEHLLLPLVQNINLVFRSESLSFVIREHIKYVFS